MIPLLYNCDIEYIWIIIQIIKEYESNNASNIIQIEDINL